MATQIYPATGTQAEALAGYRRIDGQPTFDPESLLRIGRVGVSAPAMPYSAFGQLTLGAASVEQGGVVRAPLGAINFIGNGLGRTEGGAPAAGQPHVGERRRTGHAVRWYHRWHQLQFCPATRSRCRGRVAQREWHGTPDRRDLRGVATRHPVGCDSGPQWWWRADRWPVSSPAVVAPPMRATTRWCRSDAQGRFLLPGLADNPVYAIVPGIQAVSAPVGGEAGAVQPLIGQQITIDAGVPGLPAGIYTLLPSTYALLPGAFRVELNGLAGQGANLSSQALRNGSWSTSGYLSVAGTTIRDALPSQVILSSADVLRRYSQYTKPATPISSWPMRFARVFPAPCYRPMPAPCC
ncbi:hypothetical protein L1887_46960 [Cichorium endivia]|nr:hypothetical protein L1887_46960 [Cichorium endivia]